MTRGGHALAACKYARASALMGNPETFFRYGWRNERELKAGNTC